MNNQKAKASSYLLGLFICLALLTLTVTACAYFRDIVKGQYEEEQAVINLYKVSSYVLYAFDFIAAGFYAYIRMKEAKALDANAIRNVQVVGSDCSGDPAMLLHVDNVAKEKVVVKMFKEKHDPVDAVGTVNNND